MLRELRASAKRKRDESQSLAEAGLVPNGALIVLPRRRRPVL